MQRSNKNPLNKAIEDSDLRAVMRSIEEDKSFNVNDPNTLILAIRTVLEKERDYTKHQERQDAVRVFDRLLAYADSATQKEVLSELNGWQKSRAYSQDSIEFFIRKLKDHNDTLEKYKESALSDMNNQGDYNTILTRLIQTIDGKTAGQLNNHINLYIKNTPGDEIANYYKLSHLKAGYDHATRKGKKDAKQVLLQHMEDRVKARKYNVVGITTETLLDPEKLQRVQQTMLDSEDDEKKDTNLADEEKSPDPNVIHNIYQKLIALTDKYKKDGHGNKNNIYDDLAKCLKDDKATPSEYDRILKYSKMLKDTDMTVHRTARWKRYIANVLSVLTVFPALVRAISSKASYGTFKFWKPDSEKTKIYAESEIKKATDAVAKSPKK